MALLASALTGILGWEGLPIEGDGGLAVAEVGRAGSVADDEMSKLRPVSSMCCSCCRIGRWPRAWRPMLSVENTPSVRNGS